jgi:predicted nucleic acid-binding protein
VIILDTNVVSELMKPDPAEPVVTWIAARPALSLFTTSITQAEVLHGALLLPAGKRREALEDAARAMFDEDFAGRILAFDSFAAALYARIAVARRHAGRPISHFDAQIAAIAAAVGATIATRNVADFEACGVALEDPWEAR